MSFLRPNLVLRGKWQKATYTALQLVRNDCPHVWFGKSNDQQCVILKEAPDSRAFNAELNTLGGYLRGHGSFRQLINIIPDQKIMVYEYLAENLHTVLYARPQRRLKEEEVKRVAKVVLKGLATMHEKNMAHTDIKSDNIVVDFNQQGTFSRIKVIDLGETVEIEPTTDHPFTHPTYQAPEGLLGLPWTTKVDLWALGTLIMWGLTGARMFSLPGVDEDDEIYLATILMLQCAYFGPFPNNFMELSDATSMAVLNAIEGLVAQKGGRSIYRNALVTLISKETVGFLDKLMKLDPKDRPSPQELLQDEWFSDVAD
ncbi:hypothetical protein N7G274_010479 [Stereocaulon virgatum]|uniref:Protein kinase domain-containing protein n=1 Tax=Stereocaulon virgatum TaxID=373712 RepID=A0ABR3ZTE7_9LECA